MAQDGFMSEMWIIPTPLSPYHLLAGKRYFVTFWACTELKPSYERPWHESWDRSMDISLSFLEERLAKNVMNRWSQNQSHHTYLGKVCNDMVTLGDLWWRTTILLWQNGNLDSFSWHFSVSCEVDLHQDISIVGKSTAEKEHDYKSFSLKYL